MKTLKLIGLIGILCIAVIGCDLGTGGNNNNETFTIGDLKVKDSEKSLYLSNVSVNNGSRAVSDFTIQTLAYINSNGQNAPFAFITPSGKNIVLEVNQLRQLDDKRIVVEFYSYYEITIVGNVYTIGEKTDVTSTVSWTASKQALIDMVSGKVYDVSGYVIHILDENNIYATLNTSIIYKISLNDLSTAIPLNNPEYYSLDNVGIPYVFNNKIIASNYVLDVNLAFSPKTLKNAFITNTMCSFIPVSDPCEAIFLGIRRGLLIQDLTGNLWYFITGGRIPGFDYYDRPDFGQNEKYFLGKLSIDNDGQVILSDYYEDIFSFTPDASYPVGYSGFIFSMNSSGSGSLGTNFTKDLLLMYRNGFVRIRREISGFRVESVVLTIPFVDDFFIKDDYYYYLEGTSIKRLYLSSGSTPETIYTNSRILTGVWKPFGIFKSSGDTIIFYQFAEDNITVNTLTLNVNKLGSAPALLSTSEVEIQNILELDF
jgi:hypothetical protein